MRSAAFKTITELLEPKSLDLFTVVFINVPMETESARLKAEFGRIREFPANPYLTKHQIAELFQVTERTIDSWMERRLIPFVKIGRTVRFRIDDLESSLRKSA